MEEDKSQDLIRIKNISMSDQILILQRTIVVVLEGASNIDMFAADVAERKKSVENAEAGQLQAMQSVLDAIPHPITELDWDMGIKEGAKKQLASALRSDGRPRYTSQGSLDVMLNMLKVATIGLTLAKHEQEFAPGRDATSLKKYVAEVRPKLHNAFDPATNLPRLKLFPTKPKKPKDLSGDTFYWLIGCETEHGVKGANTVLGGAQSMIDLEREALRYPGLFKSFCYVTSKMESFDLKPPAMPIQNAAVLSKTISNVEG